MKDGPSIAPIAALAGDPARANMLSALLSGKALTATELAGEAGVTAQTASAHLSKLEAGGLIAGVKQGRHRYFRLADSDVGEMLEKMMGVAARAGHLRARPGPADPGMRKARVCYDHLAGEMGVALFDGLVRGGHLADKGERLTRRGARFARDFGIDVEALAAERRPVCKTCLDWSQRRFHLAGGLGAALLTRLGELGWARRDRASRTVIFSAQGERKFAKLFGGGETLAILAVAVFGAVAGANAQTAKPNDYTDPANWLCRPGRTDACVSDQTATAVSARGRETVETWKADPHAPIDCFYVYPTVSDDPTPNSDMIPGRGETSVVVQQVSRLAAKCRVYAPMYRQITLTALAAMLMGKPMAADRVLAYNDVRDAWNAYLAHDNHGRGVVLIGHSQGSGVLTALVQNEIDGKPIQKQVVSVILGGTSLQVPVGKDVGGDFKSVALCHSMRETGCVIAFASFRAATPPPADSLFVTGKTPGMASACVNPASLGGGRGALEAYLPSGMVGLSSQAPVEWVKGGKTIATPFVTVPGLLSAECATNERGTYLAVTVNGDPKDPRADDIIGDVVVGGQVQQSWGLHLIDMNLTMGNLAGDAQSKAWRAAHAK